MNLQSQRYILLLLITSVNISFGQNAKSRSFKRETARNPVISSGEHISINSDLITLSVTVTDAGGHHVRGLDRESFIILDENVPQTISFFRDDDGPASIGIVFDTSGSITEDKLIRSKLALSHFIDTSHPHDEFFLIGFNSKIEQLLNRTRDSDAVLDKFTYVQPRGNTALYDAAYLGINKVMTGSHNKRAILIISDGEDNYSRYTLGDVRRLVKESDVIIYAVGILGPELNASLKGRVSGRRVLEELTSLTGGKAFFPKDGAEMHDAFEYIALDMRYRYSIGYKPLNFTADGRWHRTKVQLKIPVNAPGRLFVRSRAGYYAGVITRDK
jgi:Ca-activated chloride channel homolog